MRWNLKWMSNESITITFSLIKYKSSFWIQSKWNWHNDNLINCIDSHSLLMISRIWISNRIAGIHHPCQWLQCAISAKFVWLVRKRMNFHFTFNETNICFAVQSDGQIGAYTHTDTHITHAYKHTHFDIWYPYHHSHMIWRWSHIYIWRGTLDEQFASTRRTKLKKGFYC